MTYSLRDKIQIFPFFIGKYSIKKNLFTLLNVSTNSRVFKHGNQFSSILINNETFLKCASKQFQFLRRSVIYIIIRVCQE